MCRRPFLAAALLAAVTIPLAGATPAGADTIHLRNGRVIRSVDARVEDGHVVFWQFGSRQAIPLSVVDRVVEDATRGPGEPASRTRPAGDARPGAGSAPDLPAAARTGPGSDAPGRAAGTGDAAAAGLGGLDLATLAGLAGLVDQGGGSGAGVDPSLALGALQSLGAGGILPLADRLGTLGESGAGAPGDLGKILQLVPVLRELGEVLAADDPSPERTSAATRDLLRSLSELGVTEEMIRAEAARLGISLEGFTFPRR